MIQKEHYANAFNSGGLSYPETTLPKDKAYFLERAKYYYGMYCAGGTACDFAGKKDVVEFQKLRAYAKGKQDISRLRDIIDPKGKNQKRRMNISFRPVQVLSKYRRILLDKLMSVMYDVDVTAFDDFATAAKQDKLAMMRFLSMPETKQFMSQMPTTPNMVGMEEIESPDDLDLMVEMGQLRLVVETMMKDLLDLTRADSQYSALARMLCEDLIDLNVFAVHLHRDKYTNKFRYKYIDPQRLIIRSSIYPDCRDIDFAGYIESKKVSDIRMESMLSDDELLPILKSYGNLYGNKKNGGDDRKTWARGGFNNWSVDVMTLYFIDSEVERYVRGNHKKGGHFIFDLVSPDSKLEGKGNEGKELVDIPFQCVYTCKWVVGTEIVYDFGKDTEMVRYGSDGNKKPVIPIVAYIGQEPSMIEQCIGFDDDIQLATFKIRNVISKLPPAPRMILFRDSLRDVVSIGNETFSILDLIQEYQKTGVMVMERQPETPIPGMAPEKNGPVFDFVPAGIQEDISILHTVIATAIENIRQVTGINPVADGTSSSPDLLKGVMAGMQAATNSAISPYLQDWMFFNERLFTITAYRWQIALMSGDKQKVNLTLSPSVKRTVEAAGNIVGHEWNISVKFLSNDSKQLLLSQLMSGKFPIPEDVIITLSNHIMAGDLKKAQWLFAKHSKRAREEAQRQQMELVQAQNQGLAQVSAATEAAKQQTLTTEYNLKADLLRLEKDLEEQSAISKHGRDIEILTKENQMGVIRETSVVRANQKQ